MPANDRRDLIRRLKFNFENVHVPVAHPVFHLNRIVQLTKKNCTTKSRSHTANTIRPKGNFYPNFKFYTKYSSIPYLKENTAHVHYKD